MRILILGSRKYSDLDAVKEFVKCLPLDTILLTDRSEGVVNVARNQASFQDLIISDYYTGSKYDHFAKELGSHLMVDDADEVYGFWDGDDDRLAELFMYAKSRGNLQKIFHSDGTVDVYNERV